MAGAEFVRADLHVHTFADRDLDPAPDLDAYVQTALARDLGILAITDHSTARFVSAAIKAAEGKPLFIVPGVEVSTHDGHLLGLFSQNALAELEAFANATNLKITELPNGEQRSTRGMLDLVDEISRLGGLAIPAHVDAGDGLGGKLKQAEMEELLSHPGLAGLEFRTKEALVEWFTDSDSDPARLAAWRVRQNDVALRERGLARLMSSDAHSTNQIGVEAGSRTLTRLRMDDLNFEALTNAILNNPRGRCRAEVQLPASYPRIVKAEFDGGFLDGVKLSFSPNLNCLIGGRGSGKSTALLAIRAALGAKLGERENPDEPGRMPDETRVEFIDGPGSLRTAVRKRGETPIEPSSGSPIRLRLADLGQDESGELARQYEKDPKTLLEFLDEFVVKHQEDEAESDLMAKLDENASEVRRTAVAADRIKELEGEQKRLLASLDAAKQGRIEEIAKWATLLAAQRPLLERLDDELALATQLGDPPEALDLDALAQTFDVDLAGARAAKFVEGENGLRAGLAKLEAARGGVRTGAQTALQAAAKPALEALEAWKGDQADLEARLNKKQEELEQKGLTVQAGAVRRIADRLNEVKTILGQLKKKQEEHRVALETRRALLTELHANRTKLHKLRGAILGSIVESANKLSDGRLVLRVSFVRQGINAKWVAWLTKTFDFRTPRVQRVAESIDPRTLAEKLLNDPQSLLSLKDVQGSFFTTDSLKPLYQWETLFELETMLLEDRPRIDVKEHGGAEWRAFDRLSAGQQRSVLLSLMLCAERYEPLVIDQPEDHLDAQYIATGVVQHLEAAKERRQLILATHSANLTVLGDAELVIPLRVEDGKAEPHDAGGIDRPSTRKRVCELLEGGVEAFERRGKKYGFRFAARPPDVS